MTCLFRHDWYVPRDRARECRRCGKYQTWFSYDQCWMDEPKPGGRLVWTVDGPTLVYDKEINHADD